MGLGAAAGGAAAAAGAAGAAGSGLGAAALAGGIGAAGSIAGSAISASGAKSAGKQQAFADQQAALLAQQRYEELRGDLAPYNATGTSLLGPLSGYYANTQGALDTAFNNAQAAIPGIPDEATILSQPGYSFNLTQGLKAIQNQEAYRGLGLSGAATKAAQNYATGLANQYYQNYFSNQQTRFGDQSQQLANAVSRANAVFQELYYPTNLGEAAAAQTATQGANLAATSGNALMGAGQAQATGTATSAGALSGGLQNASNIAGNNLLTYALMNQQAYQNAANTGANNSPAVNPGGWFSSGAPDYTGGATPTQLAYLGLNPNGGI